MSKICQITGKKAQIGNNVSHSKHRTKRSFDVNLFSKKFYYVEENFLLNRFTSKTRFVRCFECDTLFPRCAVFPVI